MVRESKRRWSCLDDVPDVLEQKVKIFERPAWNFFRGLKPWP